MWQAAEVDRMRQYQAKFESHWLQLLRSMRKKGEGHLESDSSSDRLLLGVKSSLRKDRDARSWCNCAVLDAMFASSARLQRPHG